MDISSTSSKRLKSETLIEEETRNWVELPPDVMISIFSKLDTFEILFFAQFVCSYWQKLSKDPHLFRSLVISMAAFRNIFRRRRAKDSERFTAFGKEAVHRSHGEAKDLYIDKDCPNTLLDHICSNLNLLRRLHLSPSTEIRDHTFFIRIVKQNPLLEEVEISRTQNSEEVITEIGRCCSNLKCFRFNYDGFDWQRYVFRARRGSVTRDLAFVIAKNMSQLRELYLSGDGLTNDGLLEILDGCKNLEYLDLRQYRRPWELKRETLRKCVDRIKVVKEPEMI